MTRTLTEAAADRLRASMIEYYETLEAEGEEIGYRWAAEQAEFVDLERLANLDLDLHQTGIHWGDDELLIAVTDSKQKTVTITLARGCLESDDFWIEDDHLTHRMFWEAFLQSAGWLYEELRVRLSA